MESLHEKGTIDWFSKEKGYGFLSDDSGFRRFFHITDTTPGFRPEAGCTVLFDGTSDKRGPRATNVRENPEGASRRPAPNGRMYCPHCSATIIPRVVFNIGTPVYSVCSFCGGIVADFRKERSPKIKPFANRILSLIGIVGVLVLVGAIVLGNAQMILFGATLSLVGIISLILAFCKLSLKLIYIIFREARTEDRTSQ